MPKPSTTAILILSMFLPALPAQDSKPQNPPAEIPTADNPTADKPVAVAPQEKKPVEMDGPARTTIDKWNAMAYHLGTAGVKKISFKMEVILPLKLQMNVDQAPPKMKGIGSYYFDGSKKNPKGSLTWDNDYVRGQMTRQGWDPEHLDLNFIAAGWLRTLDDCKLTAKDGADDETCLIVEGNSKEFFRELRFNKEGVLTRVILEIPRPNDGPAWAESIRTYKMVDGKHLLTGWKTDAPDLNWVFEFKFIYRQVGKFHVLDHVVENATHEGKPESKILRFKDYKFNDDAVAPATGSDKDKKN